MEGQERLFRLAHEAIAITARYDAGEGWFVTLHFRRGDETWEQARSSTYSHLSAYELYTAITHELETAFGI